MATYITRHDVDRLLGESWTTDADKPRAVLMANAWLTTQRLRGIDAGDMPDDVVLAGAYAASVAAKGKLYEQKSTTGVLASETVEAKGVKVSETYTTGTTNNASTLLDPDLQLALALLSPWRANPMAFEVYR
ncbi:hypothetical protein SME13J_04090 [Serratia marcescens]|nr:hypothetical protein SME13J_04090 [Serratia marcescens]